MWTCWSEPIYYGCVLIQLRELGYCLIYINTTFKAQRKLLLSYSRTFAPEGRNWSSFHLEYCSPLDRFHPGFRLISDTLLRTCNLWSQPWLYLDSLGKLYAVLMPESSPEICMPLLLPCIWDMSWTLRFKAQTILKCCQDLKISVYSILYLPWIALTCPFGLIKL